MADHRDQQQSLLQSSTTTAAEEDAGNSKASTQDNGMRMKQAMEYIKSLFLRFLGLELSEQEQAEWACQQLCIAHCCHMSKGDGCKSETETDAAERIQSILAFTKTAPPTCTCTMSQNTWVDSGGASGDAPSERDLKPPVWKLVWILMKKVYSKIPCVCPLRTPSHAEEVPDSAVGEVITKAKEGWLQRQSIEGLLNLRYLSLQYLNKSVDPKDSHYLHQATKRRPYFTYWLMFMHIVIMIITLSVYGFAPYQWDITTSTAFVQTSSLTLEVARKNVTGSVWGGPDLESLVRLGAKYAPCMRRDRQLYAAIESDRKREAEGSGCCVRRDKSGCVQVITASGCPVQKSNII